MRQAPLGDASLAGATTGVSAGQRGGGCEIRTREGLPPTRFPSVRLSVHARPGPSVTWDDRNERASADACELQRMRLRMRLGLKLGVLPPASSAAALATPDTRRAPHATASRKASSRWAPIRLRP